MRNDTHLQRIHCSIFEELLLCATYDVKQFYNYYVCHSFVQQCSTQGLLCVRHCAECKDELVHKLDVVLGLTDIAAIWERQKSKQRNMACLTPAIYFRHLAFDLFC